ncbi:uncharacterized protein CTRU02_215358 [Colletotrichum truncatum]|uniref:Uncharacterized protein n=1 Tax=Colletotrichum truncatum TaxID=5467 RepID=A0ACC3YD85_COLTU|nr:uncharacterized protein CTRU02_13314 [Colletotrichum truncatum]KAF6783552.1 hypothetical protein CTRU02_13314 [Colletotrichum truncatum]
MINENTMASDTQTSSICLNVAIDHRIRRLSKPVRKYETDPSTHVSRIEKAGQLLKLPRPEIQVTAEMAGPSVKGGIAVMLQQPRHNHPFEKGLDAVIDDCETFRALEDIFNVVSCGSLDFRKDISVIDLLPYVSGEISEVDDAALQNAFRTSASVICDKEPDVLLCAGKIPMPIKRAREVKDNSRVYLIENLGVGEQFGRTPKRPIQAKLRPEGQRGFVTIPRVNGFHPSFAINRHSHISILRQLQILIGAEVCGMYRSDWEEMAWMDILRLRCLSISNTANTSARSPTPATPSKSKPWRSSSRYIPEYQVLYSEALLDIRTCVSRLVSTDQQYEVLLNSGLSEKCNDASLILGQMHRLKKRGWPDSVAWKNEAALREAGAETDLFVAKTTQAVGAASKNKPLVKILRQNLKNISDLVTTVSTRPRKQFDLNVGDAVAAFLQLAVDVETLLLDLLQKKEDALNSQGQEDILSKQFSKMGLAPVVTEVSAPTS